MDEMTGPPATDPPPQPSLPLVIASWLVVGGCIFWGSLSVAMGIKQSWDPCAIFGGVIFSAGSLVLGGAQYLGTFRRDVRAAGCCCAILFAVGGLLLTGITVGIAEQLMKEGGNLPLEVAATFASVGALFVAAGWLNYRWQRQLSLPSRNSRWSWRLSLREILGFMSAAGVCLGISMYFINTSPERFAEHLETTNPPFGIPAGAKDICYCQGWRGTIAYEFTIDEARFRNWAEAQFADRKDSHHEENGTMRVTTYRTLLPDFHDVEQLEIPHAVIYSWAEADAGTYAVFDRDTNRVYYFSHSY